MSAGGMCSMNSVAEKLRKNIKEYGSSKIERKN